MDPGTLAAWADGSLMPREREAAQAHAADCPRCLAMLAAFARTLPEPAIVPWWSRWFSWRLLVPATAGAAAVAAWVAVQSPERPSAPDQSARSIAVAPPAEQDRLARAGPPPPGPQAPARESQAPAAAPPAPSPSDRPQAKQESVTATADDAGAGARDNAQLGAARVLVPPAETGRSAEAERSAADEASPAGAAPQAAASSAPAAAGARSLGFAGPAYEPFEVVSPDPAVRWRITGPGVERSLDGGRTWQPQSPGAITPLAAGSAPSPTVCWIVGVNGTVLVFTEAGGWRQRPIPTAVHLTGVTAVDATTATVTTADGRTYRTGDGGLTWALQETPSQPF